MSADWLAHLRDLCAQAVGDLGPVSTRAMFGGHGLYLDGRIVGVVIDGALYLKADPDTRGRFADAGGAPFVYRGQARPIEMSYWSLPEDALDSADSLRPWLRLAHGAALRKPPPRAPRR